VTVLAPDRDRSGIGRAITLDGPVSIRRTDGTDESPVYACTGTPVDCVRIGLLSQLVAHVDVVLAGINHGLNLGDDATYSGTVGAAVEAALLGYPAAAFSQETADRALRINDAGFRVQFPLMEAVVRIAVAVIQRPPPGRTAVSVNLPAATEDPRLVLTRPGRRVYERGHLAPIGEDGDDPWYHPYGAPLDSGTPFAGEPGTDFHAVDAGRISVSLISADWGDHDGVPELKRWFETLRIENG
jgi:5'-nucleotidase